MSNTRRERPTETDQSSWDSLMAEEFDKIIKDEIDLALGEAPIAILPQLKDRIDRFTSFFLSENYMLIQQVFAEVPSWSQENFGDQKGLNYIAPLMGILEEVGELQEVIELDAPKKPENSLMDEINDAVGDIGIYSIDFLARVGVNVIDIWPFTVESIKHSPVVYLSQVNHACLKRHQGIRGFDDNMKFYEYVITNMRLFLAKINSQYNLTENTITTWQRVRERNWKKNPEGKGV